MKLAFYKVGNSLGFDRHSFDDMSAEQIEQHLQPLLNDDNEAAIVNLDDEESVEFFTEEYNDEIYDLGWWCVLINEPKKVYAVTKHECWGFSDSTDTLVGIYTDKQNAQKAMRDYFDTILKEMAIDLNETWQPSCGDLFESNTQQPQKEKVWSDVERKDDYIALTNEHEGWSCDHIILKVEEVAVK